MEPSNTKDSNGRDRRMNMCMTRYAACVFGIAPSNQRSGYESLFCLGDAIKSNGFSLALDSIGLIPEAEGVHQSVREYGWLSDCQKSWQCSWI
jgi:hypothetical protein